MCLRTFLPSLCCYQTFVNQTFSFFRDSPPHVHVKELSTKLVISIIGNLSSTIRNFFPDLQVFPALGNHDYWPQVKQVINLFIHHTECVPNSWEATSEK